ncbi:UDP-glucose 4-epimerase GalE [Gottfriedia sp. NPDC056225]|uniref:UDP-glucose 4-epimerase GalE n=1 Tax=Gottfriedia sp. NPDC056225 TaxID=3345751 RepID=UPI00155880CE|nr:UDP-glucose 4-epimerase GalE [Arthrobacter citreus]
MKVLVIGGAGYIGSHTVYELIRENHEVVVIDNLSTGRKEDIHELATFYQADIRDLNSLNEVFKKENNIDVVMHFAAKLIVPESVEKPFEYYDNNVFGLKVLLEAMVANKVNNFVFSSTAAVYGEPENSICTEEDFCLPINPYGETKLAAEKLIQWSAKAYGLNYCILRYFNVAGADVSGEIGLYKDNLTHLIPVTIQAALGLRDKLVVFGTDYETKDGTCIRDYIHVTDVAKAHILGAEFTTKQQSGIFNLGSNSGYTVQEIIDMVEKVSGIEVPVEYSGRRPGDPAAIVASNHKVIEQLGWNVKNTLEDIIKSDWNFRLSKIEVSRK